MHSNKLNYVIIRADGSKEIGMGHLNRCYILANYLHNQFKINAVLMTRDNISTRLFLSNKKNTIEIVYFDEGYSFKKEMHCVQHLINKNNAKLIILDLLEVESDLNYLNTIKACNLPLCVITDDSNYHPFPVNLIINGNPAQNHEDYVGLPGKYLIGPKYFITDSQGLRSTIENQNSASILVTVGGSDHNNILFKIINALINIEYVDKVVVVTSHAAQYTEELKELKNKIEIFSDTILDIFYDVESLSSYWRHCEIAITSGGNTLFERIASGTPGATICQLTRQMEIADYFEDLGVNKNIGLGADLSQNDLLELLDEFINDKANHRKQIESSRAVVPGNGVKLCSVEINKLLEKEYEL